MDALNKALEGTHAGEAEGFVAALGPLSLGAGARNRYYGSETGYMTAVAEAVREEYRAITDAGLILQVDEPEFATSWQFYPDWDIDEYRKYLESCVEIINHSLDGLPQEQVRFHVCWGSGHRPHVTDIELKYIADLLLRINAQAYSVEAGNVRHAHEWTVWRDVKIPDGKILVPGVVSHATDLVEHPGLIAERLVNFASVVGRENLAHILPKASTRVITYVNAGSFAHTMPGLADVNRIEDIDRAAIEKCAEHNPGLIAGVKLRLVGPIMGEIGEDITKAAKQVARDHHVPFMVHIGDFTAKTEPAVHRAGELTRFLLRSMDPGDILTHLCTPNAGRVLDPAGQPFPEVAEARANGVILDSALGRGNFGYQVASAQAQLGLHPDSISSDLTALGQSFHSLLECMAKFMAIGYTLADVVKMTTASPAKVLGLQDQIGAIAVGRDADLTILDLIEGDFTFTDTTGQAFRGGYGLVPVHTVRAGESHSPGWGTHPWGWLPESA